MADIAKVPPHYLGLWERTLLSRGSAPPDTSSRVTWLQAASWHADVRIPSGRPDFTEVDSLSTCNDGQLRFLLTQEAFCGITVVVQDRCYWNRMLDFHFRRTQDYGTMIFEGDRLEERGIASDYRELWSRVPGSGESTAAYWSLPAGGGPEKVLLIAGSHFILIRSRPIWAANIIRIQERIKDNRATRAEMEAFLDFEASYGAIIGGEGVISLSTLPWREGQIAFSTADGTHGPVPRVDEFEPLLDESWAQRIHADLFSTITAG
jgi:hypothetical protein